VVLRRDDWLDLARKVDWTYRYVDEREVFPSEISGHPWLDHAAWAEWNEVYRTTYREYVANQRAKDDAVLGVRSALSKSRLHEGLDPGWRTTRAGRTRPPGDGSATCGLRTPATT